MTREERLELLKQIEKDIHVCSLESTLLDDLKSCAIHSVIEELEQEPIIDKIRAEIKDWQTDIHDNEYDADKYDFVFERIFEIIDKYKKENEVSNGNDD